MNTIIEEINSFDNEYGFLSNFYNYRPIWSGAQEYKTAEHMYQAMKTNSPIEALGIIEAETPGQAKLLGQRVTRIKDWDAKRIAVMRLVVACKFTQSNWLLDRLLETDGLTLIEGNLWHDNFWGECFCGKCEGGLNHLGEILMDIRGYLR